MEYNDEGAKFGPIMNFVIKVVSTLYKTIKLVLELCNAYAYNDYTYMQCIICEGLENSRGIQGGCHE